MYCELAWAMISYAHVFLVSNELVINGCRPLIPTEYDRFEFLNESSDLTQVVVDL